jgi:hypothetical protein
MTGILRAWAPAIKACRQSTKKGSSESHQYGRWRNDSCTSTTRSAVAEEDIRNPFGSSDYCSDRKCMKDMHRTFIGQKKDIAIVTLLSQKTQKIISATQMSMTC